MMTPTGATWALVHSTTEFAEERIVHALARHEQDRIGGRNRRRGRYR
jgi:hypothetical protein